jgi:hypothetical protein
MNAVTKGSVQKGEIDSKESAGIYKQCQHGLFHLHNIRHFINLANKAPLSTSSPTQNLNLARSTSSAMSDSLFGPWKHADPISATRHTYGANIDTHSTTVGTSATLHRAKVTEPGYNTSILHGVSHEVYGRCNPPPLDVPFDDMLERAKDAVETLDPEEWDCFQAHEARGAEAYERYMKASLEDWANQPFWGLRARHRPGLRTARSQNLSLYTAPRERPMSLSTRNPTRKEGARPHVVGPRRPPASASPTSIPPIFLGMPCTINYPVDAGFLTSDGECTLKKEAFSRFIASLAPLEPSLCAVINQPLGSPEDMTEALISKQVAGDFTTAYDLFLKYGTTDADFEPNDTHEDPGVVHSTWKFLEVDGQPSLKAKMMGRNQTPGGSMASSIGNIGLSARSGPR